MVNQRHLNIHYLMNRRNSQPENAEIINLTGISNSNLRGNSSQNNFIRDNKRKYSSIDDELNLENEHDEQIKRSKCVISSDSSQINTTENLFREDFSNSNQSQSSETNEPSQMLDQTEIYEDYTTNDLKTKILKNIIGQYSS